MSLHALILSGDGINCEKESAAACEESGFTAKIMHINDLLHDVKEAEKIFAKAALVVIPGGFSFGDELGSGKVFALKLKHGLPGIFEKHIADGGAVLGICNGFQVLTKLGVFNSEFSGKCALLHNEQGVFINQWTGLEIIGQSIFTDAFRLKGNTMLELPIRHGEGRFMVENEVSRSNQALPKACVLRYTENVNGAWQRVAGIATASGRVLGLMPHPEAFWSEEMHPERNPKGVPLGIEFFTNAFEYLSKYPKTGGSGE